MFTVREPSRFCAANKKDSTSKIPPGHLGDPAPELSGIAFARELHLGVNPSMHNASIALITLVSCGEDGLGSVTISDIYFSAIYGDPGYNCNML